MYACVPTVDETMAFALLLHLRVCRVYRRDTHVLSRHGARDHGLVQSTCVFFPATTGVCCALSYGHFAVFVENDDT